MKKFKIK